MGGEKGRQMGGAVWAVARNRWGYLVCVLQEVGGAIWAGEVAWTVGGVAWAVARSGWGCLDGSKKWMALPEQ